MLYILTTSGQSIIQMNEKTNLFFITGMWKRSCLTNLILFCQNDICRDYCLSRNIMALGHVIMPNRIDFRPLVYLVSFFLDVLMSFHVLYIVSLMFYWTWLYHMSTFLLTFPRSGILKHRVGSPTWVVRPFWWVINSQNIQACSLFIFSILCR